MTLNKKILKRPNHWITMIVACTITCLNNCNCGLESKGGRGGEVETAESSEEEKKTPKPVSNPEAVKAAAEGQVQLSPEAAKHLLSRMQMPTPPSPLTERETEVLALVARGMTNAEIAAHLFVAEQTVKTHVSRVLMKLGLRDRAQAVVFAYESGLVHPGA